MARITVLLPEPTGDALCALADQEWRRPADQAAYLITEALRQRGVLAVDRAGGGEDAQPSSAAK